MNLTLRETRKETKEVETFIFASDGPGKYKAGMHVVLRLPHKNPDGRGIIRSFTASSSPTEEGIITITTRPGPSSFKKALFSLPIGSTLEARGPAGTMYLLEEMPGQHVMLAGGIGVTPFRSMIKYAFDKHLSLSITLLYSNKIPQDIIFRKELDQIASQVSNIQIVYTMTQPKEGLPSTSELLGRIDAAMIKEHVSDLLSANFYTAGPTAMVEEIIELIKSLGVPQEHVRFEKFSGY